MNVVTLTNPSTDPIDPFPAKVDTKGVAKAVGCMAVVGKAIDSDVVAVVVIVTAVVKEDVEEEAVVRINEFDASRWVEIVVVNTDEMDSEAGDSGSKDDVVDDFNVGVGAVEIVEMNTISVKVLTAGFEVSLTFGRVEFR